MAPPRYYTQNQVNKPIKFMGLSSRMIFAIIGILGLNVIFCVTILGLKIMQTGIVEFVLVIPITLFTARMNTEWRKGNKDYIGSLFSFMRTPRRIVDRKGLFKMLINE